MCSRFVEAKCCVCHRYLDQSVTRIIVEICGHKKCRQCFIREEDGCSICVQEQNASSVLCNPKSLNSNAIHDNDSSPLNLQFNETTTDKIESSDAIENAKFCSVIDKSSGTASHIITISDSCKIIGYKCSICEKSFKSRNNRKYHVFCDKSRSKPFKCNQCDKQFITIAHLKYHRSTHDTHNSQFTCQHCNKTYLRDIALKKHLRKHQNDLKYECQECDEKFIYKEQLNIHRNRHKNIFHKCPECDKRFLIKSNFTKHIQIHSGENRKICSICKHSFSGNSALKTHMLTHSKSKPFQCSKCMKKFIDHRTLERHWKTHFENICYECTMCPAKSGRKDNIRRHVRNLHSNSGEEIQSILKKIFDNYANKHNSKVLLSTRENETEKKNACVNARETQSKDDVNECEVAIPSARSSSLKNIATSVIKFAGRAQDQQPTSISDSQQAVIQSTKEIHIDRNERRDPCSNTLKFNLDQNVDTGVDLNSYNYEPLNYDPFPEITPLPLINTSTNLTVYRQLLSPYLKKSTKSNDEVAMNANVGEPSLKSTTIKIDRPPKKMIEKYAHLS